MIFFIKFGTVLKNDGTQNKGPKNSILSMFKKAW